MKLDLRPLIALMSILPALVASACGGSDAALPPSGDGGGDTAGNTDAGAAGSGEPRPEIAPEAVPEAAPEAAREAPVEPKPSPCPPVSPSYAAVCGRSYRGATLPFLPADPRADGKGAFLVVPFDCDPTAPKDDPDGCGTSKAREVGTPFTVAAADLSGAGAEIEYSITDLEPGRVHLVALLVETQHPLEGGLAVGDTLVTPVPRLMLAAGESLVRDLKLSSMAREIQVTVSADPALIAPGDKKGPLVVLAYGMPPADGVEPIAAGLAPAASLPMTVPVVVLQAKTHYLNAILDDDDSSKALMTIDAILTPGDLLHLGGVPVTIAPDALSVKATVKLDQVWQ